MFGKRLTIGSQHNNIFQIKVVHANTHNQNNNYPMFTCFVFSPTVCDVDFFFGTMLDD